MTTPTPAAPRLPIPGGMALTITMDQGGQPAAVVLGLSRQGTAAAATAPLAKAALDHYWSILRNLMVTQVVCTGGVLRLVDGSNQVFELPAPTVNPAGGAAGAAATAAACTLLKHSTANGSRSGKGRTYVPGLPASAIGTNGRNYTSAWATIANDQAGNLRNPVPGWTGVVPVVLSYKLGSPLTILSSACAPVIGLQRKRMR